MTSYPCNKYEQITPSYLLSVNYIPLPVTTVDRWGFPTRRSTAIQSQKTQGFCVADFATLSDERRSRSKIFSQFIWIKEPCVRKFEVLERSKLLGISQ